MNNHTCTCHMCIDIYIYIIICIYIYITYTHSCKLADTHFACMLAPYLHLFSDKVCQDSSGHNVLQNGSTFGAYPIPHDHRPSAPGVFGSDKHGATCPRDV